MIPSRFPDPGEGDESDRAWDRYKDGPGQVPTVVEEARSVLVSESVCADCHQPISSLRPSPEPDLCGSCSPMPFNRLASAYDDDEWGEAS